jgi:hypothetical protein
VSQLANVAANTIGRVDQIGARYIASVCAYLACHLTNWRRVRALSLSSKSQHPLSRSLVLFSSHERVYVLFCLLYTHLLTFMLSVRFLNLVRPFLPFLPEVSSPDRKVCAAHDVFLSTYSRRNYASRSLSTKRYYGPLSRCSFSWCARKCRCTVSCRQTLLTPCTGCVSSSRRTVEHSWNLVSRLSLPLA